MQQHEDEKVREALKLAFPAVDMELDRDLWPLMVRRMDRPVPAVPWHDLALAAVVAGVCVFFPKLALLLAYHL